VIDAFRERFDVTLETVKMADENVAFNVPRELRTTTNP
jgi:4-hydroxy-3-methylbut-2-enyl diphosphate reductase